MIQNTEYQNDYSKNNYNETGTKCGDGNHYASVCERTDGARK